MKVPFVDLKPQFATVKDEVRKAMDDVLEKGNFILGDQVKSLETNFAAYCGTSYGVGLNSGTDALHFALTALGVKAGDEVIVPTHTFIATALGVSFAGAKPVLADITSDTYTLDPA
ncbi:MAG TPA: aminotransferase class I/II-fold pyridoxal phosphate-dependent enzyme, partial [Candidatus Bathyarchaeia archaeon]|nr:aminotransferase class I/II-fold pyridoxal phosphate-dependent enzyme [Candidatus Bathyarchaeia archaeon]